MAWVGVVDRNTNHLSWMRLSRSDLRRAEQRKKSKREAVRGEESITGQSRGKVMGDPAQSSLSVCTAELLLLAHLLHHLDHPPHTHHHPLYHAPPPSIPPFSCLFIYLWFPSTTREPAGMQNKDGGYRGRNEWREGSGGVEQRVCFWRVSAAHMLSKESWHQSTAGNCGWGGDGGVDVL